jgi:hypothetical protein
VKPVHKSGGAIQQYRETANKADAADRRGFFSDNSSAKIRCISAIRGLSVLKTNDFHLHRL